MFSRRTQWDLAPNRLTLAHQEALASGKKTIDLTISNPTRAEIRYDESAILNALNNGNALDYDPQPRGLHSARHAVSQYYTPAIDPESLILTTSTSEGYSFVFRLLCNPGEEVLVPKPSYPLFDFLAELQDVNLVPYSLLYDHGWQIDLHSLENAITSKSRAIVLVHPNNPTGSYVSAQERQQLNDLCRRRSLALIVDEVFLDYAHGGEHRPSFVTNKDALTFTLSGISKIAALPQMKLAWIAISGPSAEVTPAVQRLEVIADTYLSLNAPIQLAAPVLLDQRKTVQPQLLQRVRANLAELDRQLTAQKSCARLEVQGGWYAVLRIPITRSDEDFSIELLQRSGVLIHPGHFYDFPSDGYLVLSLIAMEDEFRNGVAAVLEFADKL
ncbi:MAG TPA: pyridoxal phosphate-dependent aminotransferase [Terriglobales bacterium]|jgi:aspartate/methionine/tyrosine aminotransferase|nr:pyridoxal phosphate-dependent aminotransferase [Terriglobales bacterium]